eukprot:TRINITY_DN25893_c0_g1_i1.p1 TRINITY_DN25893_c0_g1~~TRINITY_DN25893_c0_g1_i1.p1  ORF type:complete len:491 (+),score=82.89 TRINITY_DN25893_c0_g1_i1:69-1475(+)
MGEGPAWANALSPVRRTAFGAFLQDTPACVCVSVLSAAYREAGPLVLVATPVLVLLFVQRNGEILRVLLLSELQAVAFDGEGGAVLIPTLAAGGAAGALPLLLVSDWRNSHQSVPELLRALCRLRFSYTGAALPGLRAAQGASPQPAPSAEALRRLQRLSSDPSALPRRLWEPVAGCTAIWAAAAPEAPQRRRALVELGPDDDLGIGCCGGGGQPLRLLRLAPGSPFARCGLAAREPPDVVLQVDGVRMQSLEELQAAFGEELGVGGFAPRSRQYVVELTDGMASGEPSPCGARRSAQRLEPQTSATSLRTVSTSAGDPPLQPAAPLRQPPQHETGSAHAPDTATPGQSVIGGLLTSAWERTVRLPPDSAADLPQSAPGPTALRRPRDREAAAAHPEGRHPPRRRDPTFWRDFVNGIDTLATHWQGIEGIVYDRIDQRLRHAGEVLRRGAYPQHAAACSASAGAPDPG